MKVRVRVELAPSEHDAAAAIEAELRGALRGADADVAVERGSSAAAVAVSNALREEDAETLGTVPPSELPAALAEVACSSSSELQRRAVAFTKQVEDDQRRASLSTAIASRAVEMLTNNAVGYGKAEYRRAAGALAALVEAGLASLQNMARVCVTLFRTQETVVPAAVLLATLISKHSAALQQLPEAVDLRKVVAIVTSVLPPYESVFIAEGMGWAQPTSVATVRRLASPAVSNQASALVTGLCAVQSNAVACSSDGNLFTFDTAGGLAAETCSLGDVMPTALDVSVPARQLVVALAERGAAPKVCFLSEAEGRAAWMEQAREDVAEPGSIIAAMASLRNVPHTALAESRATSSSLRLYDVSRKTEVLRATPHTDVITDAHAPASREGTIITASRDKTVALFDTRAGQQVSVMNVHSNTVSSVTTEGDVVVAAGLDGRVAVCDLRSFNVPVGRRTFDTGVLRCALGPSHLCLVATQSALSLMSLHTAEMPISRVDTFAENAAPCTGVAWIPHSATFCVAAGPRVDFMRPDAQPQMNGAPAAGPPQQGMSPQHQ